MATCQYCEEAIRWEKTPKGKRMALNVERTTEGNVLIVNDLAHVVGPEYRDGNRLLYVPHRATCRLMPPRRPRSRTPKPKKERRR